MIKPIGMMYRNVCRLLVLIFLFGSGCHYDTVRKGAFICPPCNQHCDTLTFSKPGTCPHCQMKLVVDDRNQVLISSSDQLKLDTGSGAFKIKSLRDGLAPIKVQYYLPNNYSDSSRILLVIPGAGRNGDSYRDAWIPEAEKHSLLVLSPSFSEQQYLFSDYHLAGLVNDVNVKDAITYSENSNRVWLDEEKLTIEEVTNQKLWLFNEFDHIFETTMAALSNTSETFDLFGHSAGGQILHRLAVFYQSDKIGRIVAANSGFYTLPDTSLAMPFGIQNMNISGSNLKAAFANRLVIQTGELDNDAEQGGILLRSSTVDRQGTNRFDRAHYFYTSSKAIANQYNYTFNWVLEVVPDVGHSHSDMGNSAAILLYGQ